MVAWADTELASPHNKGTCRQLLGDCDPQGDGRNPRVSQ